MSDNSLDNKKIVLNTTVLYIKLIINITISFVTSRLILDALGASNYGLYNVVGGVVAMLNTLSTTMVATSYRYMTVELGKEEGAPNRVYNTIFIIHLILAVFLLIIGETLGVFYVNNYLNIDPSKIPDALFVLHLSLLTTAFVVITVPMNGLIIAREKFLYMSVVDSLSAITKLLLVVLLMYMDGNRLRIYAIILALIQLLSPIAYQIYCRIKDAAVVKWNFNKNIDDYKAVLGFAWWMSLGTVAVMGKLQGAAMIINYFFGTILNAAFGLASQVSNAVSQFTTTLRQAAIPQIMKSQSLGDESRSLTLVYAMSRYSYLCMNIIAIPLLLCMDDLLIIWLGDPPEFTMIFINFMLVSGMFSNLGAGFDATIQATGKVKKNQIGYSLINLALLPIIFILYEFGLPPYINVVVMLFLTVVTLVFQLYIMIELTSFKMKEYVKRTLVPSFLSTAFAFLPLLLLKMLFSHAIIATFLYMVIASLWTCISIYFFGVTKEEKMIMINIINKTVVHKVKSRL